MYEVQKTEFTGLVFLINIRIKGKDKNLKQQQLINIVNQEEEL
ncbi:hypothetical protein NIES4106_28910 [Fischerella sp. NIES-4106]|nr:hypothetical protein NIES4106_28910 [Fischerella sp. NIES-4106]